MKLTNEGIAVLERDTHISKWVEEHRRLDFDYNMLPRILPHIRKGSVIIDVGAYIGDTTEGLRSKGVVHAFEPNPESFECLKYNMNGKDVVCRNIALSDHVHGYSVSIPNENIGMATIKKESQKHSCEGITTTIDNYCDDYGIIPNVIKIDAEGYEVKILVGGFETIANNKPLLILEVNESALIAHGTSREELFDYLDSIGYIYQDIYGEPLENLHTQFDIICHGKNN